MRSGKGALCGRYCAHYRADKLLKVNDAGEGITLHLVSDPKSTEIFANAKIFQAKYLYKFVK